MKKLVGEIEPVPSKRLLLSIIADYELTRSICELIDNAIDQWTQAGKSRSLTVKLDIDRDQQSICIADDAGGVPKDKLEVLVAPGQSGNSASDKTIGIFGVGTKRAVVALAYDVEIRSRHGREPTYLIEFDEEWLKDEETWRLPYYQTDPLPEGSTLITLSRLRKTVDQEKYDRLRNHLEATYAFFLEDKRVQLLLDGTPLRPARFESWAYPPNYEPRRYTTKVTLPDGQAVDLQAVAGLTNQSSPGVGEYGVYVYCNDRLVTRALKDWQVGFARGFAGTPHPSISLVRLILKLNGAVSLMPWNSSKSGIDYDHTVFVAIREWLIQVLTEYAKLSRNWEGSWQEMIFSHDDGEVVDVEADDFVAKHKTHLPPMPVFRPRFPDRVRQTNQTIFKKRPYTRGLADGVVAADMLSRSRLAEKNRIALIVLDSTLEIAFKDYLVHASGSHYTDPAIVELFAKRHLVIKEVQNKTKFDPDFWESVRYYYSLRTKLVHERATAPISDEDTANFRAVVEQALETLFGLVLSV